MRDVGTMGERMFETWCSSVGLTANASRIDKTGWDYLVEFPATHEHEPGRPADLAPPALECRIQVKATDKNRKKWAISLKNLERLVKTHMPTFVCVLDFDGKDAPHAGYLVHVGEDVIRRTLQRLRRLVQGGGKDTKSSTVTLTCKDSDRLQYPTGAGLKQAIESHIPDGFGKYQIWKNKLLETLGYENGQGYLNVQFSSSDPVRDLIDLSLGLRKSIKAKNVSMHDTRFKVDRVLPGFPKAGGELSMSPATLEGIVCFKNRKSSPVVEFPATVHNPSVYRVVPKERITFRIQTKFFEMIITPAKNEARFSLVPGVTEIPVELPDLRKFLEFLCMSSIQGMNGIWMYVTVDGRTFLPEAKMQVPDIYAPREELDTVEKALKVATAYGIQGKVSISLDQLMDKHREIVVFYHAVEDDKEQLTATFFANDSIEVSGNSGGILCECLSLGNYTLYCVFGLIGRLEQIDEKQYRLESHRKGFHKRGVSQNHEVDKSELSELVEQIESEMKEQGISPVVVLNH
ncbi:hypothetical protein ACFL6U_16280 [Planctomycetota bacterium]